MNKNISISTRIYDPILGRALRPLRKTILSALPQNKDLRILDLCCGTGDQLRYLENASFTNLHGLDLDPGMIAYAKSKSTLIHFHEGDAANTKFESASFDVILISLALHDKDQFLREAILKEMARLLKQDAFALAADFCFDEKTKAMGRFLISAVEFNAGGEHYRNFKDYNKRGGMLTIIPENIFEIQEVGRAVSEGIGVWRLGLNV